MSDQDVTALLQRWQAGDGQALEQLLPIVYDELRRVARARLRQEQPGHTLQATALVHEAYLRLMGPGHPTPQNRTHLFAVAAQLMRQILVDHARKKRARKRGGGATVITLYDAALAPEVAMVDILRKRKVVAAWAYPGTGRPHGIWYSSRKPPSKAFAKRPGR